MNSQNDDWFPVNPASAARLLRDALRTENPDEAVWIVQRLAYELDIDAAVAEKQSRLEFRIHVDH